MIFLKCHFLLGLVGMYVESFMEIALCVLEFWHLVQNGPLPQTLGANRSQSGRSMHNLNEPFCLLTIEILCNNLRDFWSRNGGLLSMNVFWTHPPVGGAITGQCDNCEAEIHLWHPGSVCGKFRWCRGNGSYSFAVHKLAGTDTRTHTRTHTRTRTRTRVKT